MNSSSSSHHHHRRRHNQPPLRQQRRHHRSRTTMMGRNAPGDGDGDDAFDPEPIVDRIIGISTETNDPNSIFRYRIANDQQMALYRGKIREAITTHYNTREKSNYLIQQFVGEDARFGNLEMHDLYRGGKARLVDHRQNPESRKLRHLRIVWYYVQIRQLTKTFLTGRSLEDMTLTELDRLYYFYDDTSSTGRVFQRDALGEYIRRIKDTNQDLTDIPWPQDEWKISLGQKPIIPPELVRELEQDSIVGIRVGGDDDIPEIKSDIKVNGDTSTVTFPESDLATGYKVVVSISFPGTPNLEYFTDRSPYTFTTPSGPHFVYVNPVNKYNASSHPILDSKRPLNPYVKEALRIYQAPPAPAPVAVSYDYSDDDDDDDSD